MIKVNSGKNIIILMISILTLSVLIRGFVAAEPTEPDEVEAEIGWINTVQVTNNSNSPHGAKLPVVDATGEETVMVAFILQESASSNDTDPHYRVSTNNGASWGGILPINNNASTQTQVLDVIYDRNGVAHAVWIEEQTNVAVSLKYDNSNDWANNTPFTLDIADPNQSQLIEQVSIYASGSNTLDVVWTEADGATTSVIHRRSTNGGSSWSSPATIHSSNTLSLSPDVAVDNNGIIHAVWEEGFLTAEIFYSQKASSISSWSTPIPISDRSFAVNGIEATIIIDNNIVHVAYADNVQPNQQYAHHLQCSANCTTLNNWSNPIGLNPVSGSAVDVHASFPFNVIPTMVQLGSCTMIYFHGIRTGTNEQILGTNSCNSWSSGPRDIVTETNVRSIHPNMTTLNNWFVYLVYEDASSTRQILFTRNDPAIFLPVILR